VHLDPELLRDGDALVRTVALALAALIGAWHVLGVLVCTAARVWPHRRTFTSSCRLCPPIARRVAGATASLVVVLGPAAAHAQTAPVDTPVEAPFVRAPPAPPTESAPTPETSTPDTTVPQPDASGPATTAAQHVVVPGDNLWRIAAAEVARRAGGVEPTDATIVSYWLSVIDANRSTLRSGDPSLILPGEIVTLPPA
jgi:hypothetical protein